MDKHTTTAVGKNDVMGSYFIYSYRGFVVNPRNVT